MYACLCTCMREYYTYIVLCAVRMCMCSQLLNIQYTQRQIYLYTTDVIMCMDACMCVYSKLRDLEKHVNLTYVYVLDNI